MSCIKSTGRGWEIGDLHTKCSTNECEDKAKEYRIKSVPAVAINGKLVDCCKNNGIDIDALKAAGLGK